MLTQDKDEKHSSSPKYAVHGGFKLAPLSYIGRAVSRLYTIPKSISATNSNGNRNLWNYFFNILDSGNGYMVLDQ